MTVRHGIGRSFAVVVAAALVVTCSPSSVTPNPAPPGDVNSPSASFDPELAGRLSRTLVTAVEDAGAPGAQAAVILADGSLWTAGVGLSTQDHPMTPDMLMAIASVTKVYTAALTLDLAHDGALSLDDPLTRWVPDALNAEGVTIRQLLTHTSGLASDDPTLPPVCDPGTCYSYSNGGYRYLGQVIEQAGGQDYAHALRERILSPLGLKATFYPRQETPVGESGTGHQGDEAKLAVEVATADDRPGWQGASGDIIATAADTARFAHALFTRSLLDGGGLDEMRDFEATRGLPGTSDCIGHGMVGRHQSGDLGESWFHGGQAGYFRSWVEHFPGRGMTVAVVVNSNAAPVAFIDGLARGASAGAPLVAAAPSGRCNEDIAVRAADGKVRRVTTDPGFDGMPSWAPDGIRLAWIGNRDGQNDVYVGNADGSGPVRLTNDAAQDIFPRWSPDGTAIAFSSDRDGDHEIYLMTPDGSDVRQLTHNELPDWLPAWSPDGTRIAYIRSRDGQHLRVMAADGSDDRDVTAGDGGAWWPAWSPDGARIAYESGGVIFIVPVDGGDPVRLPIPQIRVTVFPAWAPGQDILFSADGELYSTADDGTNLVRLTATSTEEITPAWSPDGSSIVFQLSHWETIDP